jgi:hypothetical protein
MQSIKFPECCYTFEEHLKIEERYTLFAGLTVSTIFCKASVSTTSKFTASSLVNYKLRASKLSEFSVEKYWKISLVLFMY